MIAFGAAAGAAPTGGMAPWLNLLDLAPVRIWLLDDGHRVRWANQAACAVLGLPLDRILALSREDFGEAHGVHDMDQRRAALEGDTAHWAGWATYPDGARRYTERSFLPFRGETDDGPMYFEFTVDQTELMRERERAEAAERRLVEAIRSLPDGLAIEDSEGRLLLCNEPYARNYGRAPETMLGLTFSERAAMLGPRLVSVGNAGDLPGVATTEERLRRVRQTEQPVHVRAIDGREFLVRRATTSDGGRIVVHSDLTALRDAWDILSDVFEACPIPILVSDARNLELRMSNAAARAMFAASRPGEPGAIGMDWSDPAERDGFISALRRDGRTEGYEARFRRGDGTFVWLSVWARLATIRGEAVVIATATDTTGERAAREALYDAWDRVSSVIEACPMPITMVRAEDGSIVYINSAAKDLMRLDTPGEGASTLPHWRSKEDRAAYLEALRAAGRVDGWEHTFSRGDGSDVHLAMWSRLAEFRGEEVIVTTSTDLTERRALDAERARQREIAHQAEKLAALGEVLAGISHELNNPLSVIVGQAAILRETAQDEGVRRRAERLSEAADRCARIVRSFLAMARQAPATTARIPISVLAREAAAIAASDIEAAGASLSMEIDDAVEVAGDPDQLRQVIVNLLVNASQALSAWPGERRITVRVEVDRRKKLCRLSVADTGPGVPEAIASRIFEPLFTTREGVGAGIGLALCHRLVRAHGGDISLAAPGPGGAVFVVELPLAAQDRSASPAADAAPGAPGPITVLVVDDDPEVRRTAAEVLELSGLNAVCAGGAIEALRLIDGGLDPDVVLTDVRMPGTDGVALFGLVKARRPAVAERFVFMTGDTLSVEIAESLRKLGRPLLEKPFLPGDLRALVATLAPAGPGG